MPIINEDDEDQNENVTGAQAKHHQSVSRQQYQGPKKSDLTDRSYELRILKAYQSTQKYRGLNEGIPDSSSFLNESPNKNEAATIQKKEFKNPEKTATDSLQRPGGCRMRFNECFPSKLDNNIEPSNARKLRKKSVEKDGLNDGEKPEKRYKQLERRHFIHPTNKRPACDIPIFSDYEVYNPQGSRQVAQQQDLETMRNTETLLAFIIETENDDDIDTDEEVLKAGRRECCKDLVELSTFVSEHKEFRGETNVVKKWRNKGIWFSQDGKLHYFMSDNAFDCKKIFQ